MKKLKSVLAVAMVVCFLTVSGCSAIPSILSNPQTLITIATDLGGLIAVVYPSLATQIVNNATAAQATTNTAVVTVQTVDVSLQALLTAITAANNANPNSNFATIAGDINTILSDTSLGASDAEAVLNGFIKGLSSGMASKTSLKLKKLSNVKLTPQQIIIALQNLK